ncbi:MAG: O-antigen ligase family protein [Betaproteobacteria bacterium]
MSAIAAAAAVPWSTALVSLACGVLLITLLASGRAHRVIRDALAQPLGVAIAVFFGVLLVGMLYSQAGWPERAASLWSWRKPAYALILLGLFGANAWKRRFVGTLVAVAAVSVVLSYSAWIVGYAPKIPSEPGVLLQNHSTQGIFFGLAMMCCLLAGLDARSRRARWGLFALAALMMLNVVFVSPGRSGYLALAPMLVAVGVRLLGWRRLPLVVAGIALFAGLAYVASPMVRERIALGFVEIETVQQAEIITSMGFRLNAWQNTFELIRERPVFGHGTGSFGAVYSARVKQRYADWRGLPGTDPHNQYLMVLAENGAIGLVAFLAVLLCALRESIRAPDGYRWIAFGALFAWSLTSLFNSHFRTFPEGHLIALVLGAMLARTPARPSAGD